MALPCLEKLLNPKKYKFFAVTSNKFLLEEANSQHSIHLQDCPDGMVVVKLPHGGPGIFTNTAKGVKGGFDKGCDYLLFMPSGSRVDIVFCELTKTISMPKNKHLEKGQQIKCTVPLLHYIMQGLEVHFDKSIKCKLHYVILCERIVAMSSVDPALLRKSALRNDFNEEENSINKAPTHSGRLLTGDTFKYGKMPISIHACTDNISISKLIPR